MILRGTPLLYDHRGKHVVVYHKGGGEGGCRCRVWDPKTGQMEIRSVSTLKTMDDKELVFKNIVAASWEVLVPYSLDIDNAGNVDHERMDDFKPISVMAHHFHVPKEQWETLWNERGNGMRTSLEPLECDIVGGINWVVNEEGIALNASYYGGIQLRTEYEQSKVFHYVPGKFEEEHVAKTTAQLKAIVNKYRKAMGTLPLSEQKQADANVG